MFGGVKCHSVTIYVNQARDSREVFWAGGGFKTLEWEDSNAPDTAGRRFYEHWSWGEHTFVRIAFSGGLQNGSKNRTRNCEKKLFWREREQPVQMTT